MDFPSYGKFDQHMGGYRQEQGKRGRGGNDWHAPPPITAQQAEENLPPRSNYTSLKRSHSGGLSNRSSGAAERKADSPKEQQSSATPQSQDESKPQRSGSRVRV